MSLEEGSRDTPILHVDMDAFYASVMTRDRPDLHDVPVVVGGGHRGVVLAANYAARRYGVRSAMPGARAHRLCPHAVVLQPDYDAVATVSAAVMECFRAVTPLVQTLSVDEAFLDVRGALRDRTPRQIAEQLRAVVHDEQRITCSVGVAPSPSVAKVASRRAKPDGVVVVTPERLVEFLHPLDVGELYGVGAKTRERLHAHRLTTVGDVAAAGVPWLQARLGRHLGAHLHALAWGTDQRTITPGHVGVFGHGTRSGEVEPERSMGHQETLSRDTADPEVVARELLRLSSRVATRLRRAEVVGRTVALTLRFSDFTTITRSRTLTEATDVTREVYQAALALYEAQCPHRQRIRLLGVRVESLVPRAGVDRQLRLGERERGWSEADRAVDLAAQRFGKAAVRPASLLP